ncbi:MULTISPECIES: hypothetical protein [Limnospira]|uniref:Uncharacterized protein n=1 Tax=Limnospira fusiformis PMC 851.14 TaxID=2219512 RepID=A0ABU9ELL5_LIMFS|nr:hypothetical protein [Limnospira sp. PMC 1042.18]MDT9200438.1 hypothetical protein [Limnospira sp. PMC 1042.18]
MNGWVSRFASPNLPDYETADVRLLSVDAGTVRGFGMKSLKIWDGEWLGFALRCTQPTRPRRGQLVNAPPLFGGEVGECVSILNHSWESEARSP